jgi:hypothetical protein
LSWAVFARLGARLSRLRAAPPRSGRARSPATAPPDLAREFSAEELAEFLAADLSPPAASPEFHQKLRDDLWAMVEDLHFEAGELDQK